jgi:hypothetical protein
LRPLRQKFEELEDLLLHHRRTLAQNTGVPFLRLVYRPEEEIVCRRFQEPLTRTLEREGVAVETVSCRDVIFTHYERQGQLDQLFDLEQTGGERLSTHIAKRARQELTQRLEGVAESLGKDGVIFLVDVAFLYPYLQLSPVLDACTNRIAPPMALVIFYPGEVKVDGQLLFLGQRPSGYYRTRDLI